MMTDDTRLQKAVTDLVGAGGYCEGLIDAIRRQDWELARKYAKRHSRLGTAEMAKHADCVLILLAGK